MSYYPNVYASQTGPLLLSGLDANFNFAVDIQSQSLYAAAGGSSDIITATYTPSVTSLISGLTLYVRAATANTTTTPTFSPNSLTAKTIVKGNNQALVAGDIAGAGHILILQYDATNGVWELANPQNSAGKFTSITNTGLTSGRVVYSTTGGLETDSANMLFDGTTFTVANRGIAKAGMPAGSVLQVINATYTTQTSTASSSLVDTGLSASITPSSASSKVLIFVNLAGLYSGSGTVGQFTITDGSNNILLNFEGLTGYLLATNVSYGEAGTNYLHSPATTSSFTYKVRMRNVAGTGISINAITSGVCTSTITLMEIAA